MDYKGEIHKIIDRISSEGLLIYLYLVINALINDIDVIEVIDSMS